jgi:hypothetical protein
LKHTVICHPRAESELATAYLAAADPKAVTSASWIIERILQESPEAFGESRTGQLRVGFEPPLAVWDSISQPDHLVLIVSFRLVEPGQTGRSRS